MLLALGVKFKAPPVRNLMFKLGELGVLSPQMEKLGLLGPTDDSKRRPGDVSFANWRNGRGLAIDVAVICPLAASHLHQRSLANFALSQKHKRYDAGFTRLTLRVCGNGV